MTQAEKDLVEAALWAVTNSSRTLLSKNLRIEGSACIENLLEAAQAVENERRARLKLGQEISDQLRELGLA